jgi:Zn-dependent protease/CBS domain-containing protein
MAVVATVGLLFSIVLHEMSHAAVAQHFGMPIRGITLFIFGGVAEMHSEPGNALSEFLMALAGPVASAVLGFLFFLLFSFAASSQDPPAVGGVLWYLSYLNWTLAVFNLAPAFPLDGGRMLRAALWGWRKDLMWATSIATRAGNIFGILPIVLGLIEVLRGDFVGGLWMALIGLFLRGAASATYEQTLAQRILKGQPVSRFMNRQPLAVSPELSLRELVEDYIYRHHHKIFPVVRDGRLLGCVTAAPVSEVDEDQWDRRTVAEIMEPCSEDNMISPETDTLEAMTTMQRTGRSPLLVVDRGQLVGVLSLRDLLEFLTFRLQFEGSRGKGATQQHAHYGT